MAHNKKEKNWTKFHYHNAFIRKFINKKKKSVLGKKNMTDMSHSPLYNISEQPHKKHK